MGGLAWQGFHFEGWFGLANVANSRAVASSNLVLQQRFSALSALISLVWLMQGCSAWVKHRIASPEELRLK
jgi:hypothetical protein